MTLLRHNILDLIGKDRRKYHSAIVTCFSFDFNFFENRVMPVFGSCGIKNVNVLMDATQLDRTLQDSSGREYHKARLFALNPIYSKAAFHPKLLLLIGVKHAFLCVGSGNFTSSGLSSNDEIWGAFHMDHLGSANAPVFGHIWSYLRPYFNQVKGFNQQQIKWITDYSPWVNDLPEAAESIPVGKKTITVLDSHSEESIFSQIMASLPVEEQCDLTIISPYFDKKGSFLKIVTEQLNPRRTRCLIDPEHGLLPEDIDSEVGENIEFYPWIYCIKDYAPEYNRLHAKLIHFKYENAEYLLFGSPNASLAGLGGLTAKGYNDECAILIARQGTSNYLKELGIHIPQDKRIALSQCQKQKVTAPREAAIAFTHRIIRAELNGQRLILYFHKLVHGAFNLIIEDRWKEIAETIPIHPSDYSLEVTISHPLRAFRLCLKEHQIQLSNFMLIHRIEQQLKCNPDPRKEKLGQLLDKDYINGEGITALLKFTDFLWADEEASSPVRSSSGEYKENQVVHTTQTYEQLDQHKFNELSTQMVNRHAGILENSSVKIAAFLSYYGKDLDSNKEELIEESAEQSLLEEIDQDGEGGQSIPIQARSTEGKKDQRGIFAYFKKLDHSYHSVLRPFYACSQLTTLKELPRLTLKGVSNVLIGIQLIHFFTHKTFKEEEDIFATIYIDQGNIRNTRSLKGFLCQVIGKYNILSYADFKKYEYEVVNSKLCMYRKELFFKSAFWICNCYWPNSEQVLKELLLLDLLKSAIEVMSLDSSFIQQELKELKIEAHKINAQFDQNVDEFVYKIIPGFLKWNNLFTSPSSKEEVITEIDLLRNGSILYNSKIGFSHLTFKMKGGNGWYLDLVKPGFLFNKDQQMPLQKNVQRGYKVVLYK